MNSSAAIESVDADRSRDPTAPRPRLLHRRPEFVYRGTNASEQRVARLG